MTAKTDQSTDQNKDAKTLRDEFLETPMPDGVMVVKEERTITAKGYGGMTYKIPDPKGGREKIRSPYTGTVIVLGPR